MSSPSIDLKISHLFKAILEGEKQLETYRKVLLEQLSFDPYLTFNHLDQSNQGYLSPSIIVNFLKKHDFQVLQIDLIVFFNSYDLSGNCQLSYSEFLNIILPRYCPSVPKFSASRESSRTPNKKKPNVPYEIEWALARLLDKQITFLKKIEVIKKGLARRGALSLSQVFNQIDMNTSGAIDIDTLYYFLRKNDVTSSEDDTVILFRAMDHDNDDLISYTEFTRVVVPASLLIQSAVSQPSIDGLSVRRSSTPIVQRSKPPIVNTSTSYAPSHQRTPCMDNSKGILRVPGHHRSYSISEKSNNRYHNNELPSTTGSLYSNTPRQQSPGSIRRQTAVQESPRFELYSSEVRGVDIERKKDTEASSIIKGYRVRDLPLARDRSLKLTPTRKSHSDSIKPYRGEYDKVIEEQLSGEEEKDFASVLKEIINLDRETDTMKSDLALRVDLNLFNIFRLFDAEGKGFIDKSELEDGLNLFQVFPTEKELDLIMRRFDRDNDDLLRCSDFCNVLTPSNSEYAEMLKSRMSYAKNVRKQSETLSMETTFLLRKTLQVIISNESYCECLRHRLNSKQGFTLYKAFKTLDREKNGFMRVEDVKQLLNNHNFSASYKELQVLMQRFVRRQDGKVTYNEFLEELKPKTRSLHE